MKSTDFLRIASLTLLFAAFLPATAQADTIVKIGFAAPLTGPSARTGKDLENAAQLAVDDANGTHPTIGGQPVKYELIPVDDQADPRAAVTVAQQLIDRGVIGVVGHYNTGCSIPASRLYHDAGIPQIAPISSGHQYTLQGFDTTFRVIGHDDGTGVYTGMYAVKSMKAKRIAVIDDQTAFGAGLAEQFIKGVKSAGGTIVDHQFVTAASTDYSAVLTAIKSKQPDLIFLGGVDVTAAPLVRRMRQLQIQATLLGAGGFVSQTFLRLSGQDGEGTTAFMPGLPLEQMPGGKVFASQYLTTYGVSIEAYAPYAYDAAATLIAATKKADSTDPSKLVAELHKIEVTGITGPIAFDAQGNLRNTKYTVYRVQGGKWTVLEGLNSKGELANSVASK